MAFYSRRRKRLVEKLLLGFSVLVTTIYGLKYIYAHLNPPIDCKAMVLVAGYMRSGSSLVGDIFQRHTSSFYIFEPLRSSTELYQANKSIEFLNGTNRKITSTKDLAEVQADILYNWFTCNFSKLDVGSIRSDYLRFYSWRTVPFYDCQKRYTTTESMVNSCFYLLDYICNHSELRAIKVIRVQMETVRILLTKLPKLRVIHLFRDPRGILQSQVRVRLTVWRDIEHDAKALCSRISSDIKTSNLIKKQFDERFKILIYETLAENPVEKSKIIYKWTNLTMSKGTVRYIQFLTNAKREIPCKWCTLRKNSVETSRRWRRDMPLVMAEIIDKHCQGVYDELGYIKFTEGKDIRNLTMLSRLQTVELTKDAL